MPDVVAPEQPLTPMPGRVPPPAAPPPPAPVPALPVGAVNSSSLQKGLLEAVAQGGKRGLQAFKDAQTATEGYKSQALGRANERAALIGGPEAQGFAPQVAQAYDTRLADIGQGATAFTEDMARRGAGFNQYFKQLEGLPAMYQQQANRQIDTALQKEMKTQLNKDWEAKATGQAVLEQENAAKNYADEQKKYKGDMAVHDTKVKGVTDHWSKAIKTGETALASIDKEINSIHSDLDKLTKGGGPIIKGERYNTRLKNQKERLKGLEQNRKDVVKNLDMSRKGVQEATSKIGPAPKAPGDPSQMDLTKIARQKAVGMGISPDLAAGKLLPTDTGLKGAPPAMDVKQLATKAKVNVADLPTIKKDKMYNFFVEAIPAFQEQGLTKEQVEQQLRRTLKQQNGKFKDRLFRVLVAEYLDTGTFPTVNEVKRTTKFEEG